MSRILPLQIFDSKMDAIQQGGRMYAAVFFDHSYIAEVTDRRSDIRFSITCVWLVTVLCFHRLLRVACMVILAGDNGNDFIFAQQLYWEKQEYEPDAQRAQ